MQRREKDAQRKRKSRRDFQSKLRSLCSQDPELAKRPKCRDGVSGRPTLETDQPGLLEAIKRIVAFGGGADARRRSELIRCCRTLDDVLEKLKDESFTISRSGLYLRFLPRRSCSTEGKRHVRTVPVKLVRAAADEHRSHPDTAFAVASIRHVKSLASLM